MQRSGNIVENGAQWVLAKAIQQQGGSEESV